MEDNWGIIGHQDIVQYLKRSLKQKRLAHTYLFYGVRHLGKTTVAYKFASQLIGEPGTSNPDFFQLEIASESKEIKIDQVRQWQHFLCLKPFNGEFKVGIIREAELLNLESANALLKTIEEPTPGTVIILVSSAWQKLLPTVISRSQKIYFQPIAKEQLEAVVLNKIKDKTAAQSMINFAQGRPGLAVRLINDPDFYQNFTNLHQQAIELLEQPLWQRLKFSGDYLNSKDLKASAELIRDLLNHLEFVIRGKLLDSYLTATNYQPAKKVLSQFTMIQHIKSLLNLNIQPRLLLENLLINL